MQRMTIGEARDILRRHEAGETVEYIDWSNACTTVYTNHMQHDHPGQLERDQRKRQWDDEMHKIQYPQHTRDQASHLHIHIPATHDQAPSYGQGASNLPDVDPRNARSGVFGAQENKTDRIGGEIVARLPRSASSYQLLDTDQGCVVLLIGDNDGSLDPGAIATGESVRMRGSGVPSSQTGDRRAMNRHHALSLLVRAAGGKVA